MIPVCSSKIIRFQNECVWLFWGLCYHMTNFYLALYVQRVRRRYHYFRGNLSKAQNTWSTKLTIAGDLLSTSSKQMVWGTGIIPNIHDLNSVSARMNYLEKKQLKIYCLLFRHHHRIFQKLLTRSWLGLGDAQWGQGLHWNQHFPPSLKWLNLCSIRSRNLISFWVFINFWYRNDPRQNT